MMKLYSFLLALTFTCPFAWSQDTNCTIDDTDASVYYNGTWGEIGPTALDYGGTHALSASSDATAIFCFKGVAIYYMSPLWPYPVNTMLTLDGNRSECINLQDLSHPATNGGAETVQSAPVWGVEGLENVEHELVVSMCPGGQFVVVDAFIFTEVHAALTTTSSGSTSSISSVSSTSVTHSNVVGKESASPSPNVTPPSNHTTAIAVVSALAALALLTALLACLFCIRRRNRIAHHPDSKASIGGRDVYGGGYTPVPSPFPANARFRRRPGMLYHITIIDRFYSQDRNDLHDDWSLCPTGIQSTFSYFRTWLSSMFYGQSQSHSSIPNL